MTKSPSDDLDQHCAAIWDKILTETSPQPEDLEQWTTTRLNTIVQALNEDRLARLRQQQVVNLAEYRKAKRKEEGR